MTDLERLAETVGRYSRGEEHDTGILRNVALELITEVKAHREADTPCCQSRTTHRLQARVHDATRALDAKLAEVIGD